MSQKQSYITEAMITHAAQERCRRVQNCSQCQERVRADDLRPMPPPLVTEPEDSGLLAVGIGALGGAFVVMLWYELVAPLLSA
jgi:hypothetical protein